MSLSVLHVDSSRQWGGGQNQIRLLMRELAKSGVHQLCICPAYSLLAERLTFARLPVLPVNWLTGSDPRALMAIARNLKDFDIVHCHDAHALQLTLIPARLQHKPIVAARRVRFKTNAFKWNHADRIIAVSETVRSELLQSGIDEARIRVIYSGTDAKETRAVPRLRPSAHVRYGIHEGQFVAGNAAAFYEAKGQTLIPQVAALLPDVQWLIAGDGPARSAIESAIRKYKVSNRVHLLGWLDDARSLLKELDAYVSTSTDDGLGNSITESLALHVPVIAADAGGPAEIMKPVHSHTNAVLFEPRNARALADAIARVRAPGVRKRIIELQDARFADFAIDRTVAATLAVYHEVIAR